MLNHVYEEKHAMLNKQCHVIAYVWKAMQGVHVGTVETEYVVAR